MMTMKMITKPANILLDEHGLYYHDDDCNEYDSDGDDGGDDSGDDADNEDDNETYQHIAG